jgi:hypothetical protein
LYAIPSTKSLNPLFPWQGIFSIVSLEQFGEIRELLDFPIEPTLEIQSIARGFVKTAFSFQGFDDRAPAGSINFFERIPTNLQYKEKQFALFDLAFSSLEELGVGRPIYDWSLDSLYFQQDNKEIIMSAYRFLHRWIGANLQFIPDGLDSNALRELLDEWRTPHWVSIAEHLAPMPLSKESQIKLYKIVLNCTLARKHVEEIRLALKEAAITAWDRLLYFRGLSGGAFLINEARYRLSISLWRTIRQQFSSEEVADIERWMLGQVDNTTKGFTIPLPVY